MKNLVDYKNLRNCLLNITVSRSTSGPLSGHVASEHFAIKVYEVIKELYPNMTYKQYEYLNTLYLENPSAEDSKTRSNLFNSPTALFLLERGISATKSWSPESLFEEKQNDTADILVVQEGQFEIIDVKTRNADKKAQAPNIISSFKLARACERMILNMDFDSVTFNYLELDWNLSTYDTMKCQDVFYCNLFEIDPQDLYINWAAALQIQFHVSDVDKNCKLSTEDWAIEYLRHFVTSARKRSAYILDKYAKPFEKYLT